MDLSLAAATQRMRSATMPGGGDAALATSARRIPGEMARSDGLEQGVHDGVVAESAVAL